MTLVENALWDVSGEQLSFAAKGSGTSLTKQRLGEHTVKTLSIDDLVEREEPQHLDFIKMDIEGAELAALQGAEKTIRQFRPKLAIALYHSPQGFVSIPQWLSNLKLGYQFFLGHYSIHAWETVLYGSPPI